MHHAVQGHVRHHRQNEELLVKCCPCQGHMTSYSTLQAYNWISAPLECLILAHYGSLGLSGNVPKVRLTGFQLLCC